MTGLLRIMMTRRLASISSKTDSIGWIAGKDSYPSLLLELVALHPDCSTGMIRTLGNQNVFVVRREEHGVNTVKSRYKSRRGRQLVVDR